VPTTREDFENAYVRRSGLTVEWLREHGRESRPCDCGEDECQGWQMANIKELQWAVDQGIATPFERALLNDTTYKSELLNDVAPPPRPPE
jgi:hypothetical protein